MAVEGPAGLVVAHCRSRVGVGSSFLHFAQGNTGVEGGGDERMPQRTRADRPFDPSPLSQPLHDPSRRMSVQATGAMRVQEDGSLVTFTDAQVNGTGGAGCEGDGDDLAPPLRRMVRVLCPRSNPRCSMSAPSASEIRSPFNANRHAKAWSRPPQRPA